MVNEVVRANPFEELRIASEDLSTATRLEALFALVSLRRASKASHDTVRNVDRILTKLAVDPDITVRHALAQELINEKSLSADVIFCIAADLDELSLPFLERSPALDGRIITAIARVGDEARKSVLAQRPNITHEAIEIILKAGGVRSIVSLLANYQAKLSAIQYENILDSFGDERAVLDGMVRRPDLPAYLKVMMAKQVSQEMRRKLQGSDEIAIRESEKKIIRAEEIALLRIAGGTKQRELQHLVHYLVERKQLTPSILLRAACTGEMDFVIEALALLSGMPAQRVRTLVYAKGALSLRAVHSKASLPKALFVPLRVAVDVENARLASNGPKSADVFGRHMVEKALTHYENLVPDQRMELLGMIGSYGAPAASALASQLMEDTAQAA